MAPVSLAQPAALPTTPAESAIAEPPIAESPVAEPPVAEPPVAEPPVVDPPIAESPVVEPPVVDPPVVDPPVVDPPVVEPPVVEPPVVEPPVVEPPVVESLASGAGAPQEQLRAPEPPALPVSAVEPAVAPLEAPAALPTSISLLPPATSAGAPALRSQLAKAQARIVSAVPPRWIEVARHYPVLWMAVAPIALASLFVLLLLAFEPPRATAQIPAATPTAASSVVETPPASAAATAVDEPAKATLAELEGKAADTLSVTELLRLNEGRAERKRGEVRALSQRLRDQADLVKDEALQAQLLRMAADPDTAEGALAAMAQARSPVGPDLLYQVWTSPGAAAGTAELARSLLYSREVRPNASPALAATLQLRAAEGCEAVKAALPRIFSEADRRSLSSLAKLNSRHGCGAKKNQDCYLCLRADMKQVVSAINAAKRRPAPSYATR